MMSACSEDIAQMINGGKKEFTATLAAPNKGGTRTVYTEDTQNNKIAVAWKVGDEIALVHNGVKDVVKVKTVNADGSATITGTITVGTNGEAVTAYYPAAAIELNNDKNPVPAAAYTANLLAQDGTLSYIASNLDLRVGESTLAVDGDKATLASSVSLTSNTAIWKLTLQDNAETPAAIKATQVSVIKDGETPETLAGTSTLSTATSTVYLAMPPMSESEATVAIKAATADGTYIYENSGLTLAAGKYYQSTVTMAKAAIDLSKLTADYEAQDGDVLTGTLAGNYKISIADGATVTLDKVTINGENSSDYRWAGITCAGAATIILKDGSTNTVKGFYWDYPGIHPAVGKTLIIKGTGSLTASSNGYGAGIGGGFDVACGNIIIEGGTITATGGSNAAGIGSGFRSNCGAIEISGGTVEATGGENGAGIGSGGGGGDGSNCGAITITAGVTRVKATKGAGAPNSIGAGGYGGTCGTVTIGCTLDTDGNPVGGTTGAISQSPYEYPPIAATAHTLAASVVGDVVDTDGNAYTLDATHVLPSGVTAVAMVAYKSGSNGLAIQLNGSPVEKEWDDAKTYAEGLTVVSGGRWRLPSKADWQNMFVGCAVSGDASAGDTMNPIAGFKAKIAATGITWQSVGYYWSSTEGEGGMGAWSVQVNLGDSKAAAYFDTHSTSSERNVLGCLAF